MGVTFTVRLESALLLGDQPMVVLPKGRVAVIEQSRDQSSTCDVEDKEVELSSWRRGAEGDSTRMTSPPGRSSCTQKVM